MQAEATGKEAVAVRDMDNVVACDAGGSQAAGDTFSPEADVAGRISDNFLFAGRAG